ncbi:hypothetical protein [Streptomyces sp. NPDC008125]|uniref:hypothetical protein n=1 Tax=Streptomyces sp. NPDC008125 TaxID=3364811 RepID=UPI0036E87CA5
MRAERRIGFIGDLPARLHTRRERVAGYRTALAETELPYDRALVAHAHAPEGAAATARLLAVSDPPAALLSGSSVMTIGV